MRATSTIRPIARTWTSSSPAAAAWSSFTPAPSRRDPDWFKTIVGGSWRNGTTKWLEGPMQLYFTDRDSPITKDVSNWAMDDEIYYDMDMLPEARVLATAYTPKPPGRNASSAATGRRAHRRRQAGEHLRRAAADVDLRAHDRRAARALPRLRVDSRASLRELQPAELSRDPPARHRLGRQACQRRRAPRGGGARRQPALSSKAARPRRRRPRRKSKCTRTSTSPSSRPSR